jgi:hypothetical protein
MAGEDLRYVEKPLVYVAAPYSRPDPVENTHQLIKIVDSLADDGVVTPVAPHLTLLWHLVAPRPLEFWYAYDLAILARCDAIYRVPGDSTGADAEVAFAESRGVPVFDDREALYEWVATRRPG